MYAVTGITGRVGGIAGSTLLDVGLPVRAVVRDATKAVAWKERGCQVALADMNDAAALAAALTHVNGVFVLIPPIFDPTLLSRGQGHYRRLDDSDRNREAAQGRLPLDDRRAGDAAEPAQPARPAGAGAARHAVAGLFPKGRLVHGECGLGRCTSARPGRRAELFAAARQACADGRDR